MCKIKMNSHSSIINFQNDTSSSAAGILIEVQVSVYNNTECTKSFEKFSKLSSPNQFDDSIICAGSLEGGEDACSGDSGDLIDFRIGVHCNSY